MLTFTTFVLASSASTAAPCPPAPQETTLRIDPRLLTQAAEVWTIAAGEDNPIWPGWDVSETPLLFYFPGEQDVLVNHPAPPPGFVPYDGPLNYPGFELAVRNGETVFAGDGQNTSKEVAGLETLVVADTLSNLRLQLLLWNKSDASAYEQESALDYGMLAADPYSQMGMILHEAFHVEQARWGLGKAGNEMALLTYPALSVTNNVGFALEADVLGEALGTEEEEVIWWSALKWLAVRQHRRAELDASAIAYEDGTEFNEGLAKYVEWRLSEVIEGREASPEMYLVRGFHGFQDMAFLREQLIASMRGFLTGEHVVNNDPYGTGPVRFRLYWSGMAIGAVLDVIYPEWKHRIMEPETTLTGLVEEALVPSADDLAVALEEVLEAPDYAELVAEKTELANAGQGAAKDALGRIMSGEGTLLTIDYSNWQGAGVGLAFTPFGITRVDDARTIYTQTPVGAGFGSRGTVRQTRAIPLLQDNQERRLHFRLARTFSAAELSAQLGLESPPTTPQSISLDLGDATVELDQATLRVEPGEIVIEVH